MKDGSTTFQTWVREVSRRSSLMVRFASHARSGRFATGNGRARTIAINPQAIAKGCTTVSDLEERLRCGTNCSSCIPELRAFLEYDGSGPETAPSAVSGGG